MANHEKRRKVALIGSSGGGGATFGQDNPVALVGTLQRELSRAGIALVNVHYTAASATLDGASGETPAALWTLLADGQVGCACTGTLEEVNAAGRSLDEKIAEALRASCDNSNGGTAAPAAHVAQIHGLVVVSCDPNGANRCAVLAARDANAPIIGTGGSSLSGILAAGGNVVGSSGSVATTNESRAAACAAGLARHWQLAYDPVPSLRGSGGMRKGALAALNACLPAFLALTVLQRVAVWQQRLVPAAKPLTKAVDDAVATATTAIPLLVGAYASKQSTALGEVGMVAGGLAAAICNAGVAGALPAGIFAGWLCVRLAALGLRFQFPTTALTLATTGCAGVAAGIIMHLFAREVLLVAGAMPSQAVSTLLSWRTPHKAAMGAALGLLTCRGSEIGAYHYVMLPLILLEQSHDSNAHGCTFLGALDAACLCATGAGVCAATYLLPLNPKADRRLAKRGAFVNVVFGDFVEACYPFLERDHWVHAATYAGAAAGGAIAAVGGARWSAYLPLPLAGLLAVAPASAVLSMAAAFGVPFAMVLLRNARFRAAQAKEM